MLVFQQKAVVKAPSITMDSLRNSLAQMQHKVDSLNLIVKENAIAKDYFHDILSSQLFFFSAFLAVLAFISWTFIVGTYYDHKKKLDETIKKRFADQDDRYDKTLIDVKSKLLETNFNSSRSMFLIMRTNGLTHYAFHWAMLTLDAALDLTDQERDLSVWIRHASVHLKTVHPQYKGITKRLDRYLSICDRAQKNEELNISKDIQMLKVKIQEYVFASTARETGADETTSSGI
jgi:hypothetical protein